MTQTQPLPPIPTRRIRAIDGMAVTADVWEESHEYHRQHHNAHALLSHGPGIVSGLDVIASDPPDTAVYIQPGIAIDPYGRTIVLAEPLSYDLGSAAGRLYLLLSYGESHPRAENGSVQEGAPLYVQAQFGLETVSSLPATPHVELARVWRQGRGAALIDAQDPAAPGPNAIDQRFRRSVAAPVQAAASMAVVHVGGADSAHGRGAQALARVMRATGPQPVWVDNGVPLAAGLDSYTLVYLVGHGRFQLTAEELNALYAYWQAGGTILVESCRREPAAAAAAEASLTDVLGALGVRLEDLPAEHPLLAEPALFGQLPAGYETEGQPRVQVGDGFVVSYADYGCLWQGERRSGPAAREDIRAAHEWGQNLIALAQARRRGAEANVARAGTAASR